MRVQWFGGAAASSVVVLFLVLNLTGCGGNVASNSPTPAPHTTGSGTTPPTTGGAVTSTAPFQQAIMATINGSTAQHGLVSVSSTGDVTIQAIGAQPSTSFTWQFCGVDSSFPGCLDLGQTLTTDASGNGQITFHFPNSGKWAGYFEGDSAAAILSTQNATQATLTAQLMTKSELNGSASCPACKQEPIKSGSVTVANGVAHIVISGGDPDAKYEVSLAGGSGGGSQGFITTDASGNVAADIPVQGVGCAYDLTDHTNAGFVTGFQVP